MRTEASRLVPPRFVVLRKCDCGGPAGAQGSCEQCRDKKEEEDHLQRFASGPRSFSAVPAAVNQVLGSSGTGLDAPTRAFFEARFGHDFGRVRVHTDEAASASARSIHALAYTVGHNVVIPAERYQPGTPDGRMLLAHELTHVVQQSVLPENAFTDPLKIDSPDSPLEQEARAVESSILSASPVAPRTTAAHATVSRADPNAVARTQNLRGVTGSGIQFLPAALTDTQIGPVQIPGGLLNGRANRLSVIVGENLTLRILAQQILPLWTTATPFTPPGSTTPAPLPTIAADDLARALFVYNQYYLPGLTMNRWRAGLRFPLPVLIDEATGMGTLHPIQIQNLASAFVATDEPKLDQQAQATAAPSAATLQADVTAFLARETTALGRGIHLGARALTNATEASPFTAEVFRQAGADAFEIVLNFMDFLVNRQISTLASQRDGAQILAQIRSAIGAAPATPSSSQQDRAARAIRMLDQVVGVTAAAAPEEFFNPCDPIQPLTWADFQGRPGAGSSAFTRFTFPLAGTGAGQRLRAVFDRRGSWVRPQFGDPSNPAVNGCDRNVRACQSFFPAGSTGGTFHLTPPGPSCPASIGPDTSIVATSFSDCSGSIATECARVAILESERLLRHEQLHFDIACILAGKANAALASGRPMTTVRAALNARATQVTNAYDTQTRHGCLAGPQATWETDVAGGLSAFHVP